jgi:hypothetical protein
MKKVIPTKSGERELMKFCRAVDEFLCQLDEPPVRSNREEVV